MTRKISRIVAATAFAAAIGLGVASLFTESQAAPRCLCPQIVAPVLCDNGKTYINSCYASCAHAKNCVPTGDI